MPKGSTITYTVTANISSAATGNLVNTATVAVPAGVTDPTPGNNSQTDTDTASPKADLSITKSDGTTTYVPGTSTTYTIVVTNSGPSNVTGATVTDPMPAAITSDSWTATATGGATGFAASGSGNISDTVNMPNGSAITYTVTANISSAATGDLVNTATVAVPAGVTDPTPGNNSQTDTDTASPRGRPVDHQDRRDLNLRAGHEHHLHDRGHQQRPQRRHGRDGDGSLPGGDHQRHLDGDGDGWRDGLRGQWQRQHQ